MKKTVLIVILCLAITQNAFCHPPTGIDMTRLGTQITVTVLHDVLDPKTHYIERIGITLNGKKIIEQNFTTQTDDDMQQVIYIIPSLTTGDKLDIETKCNQAGELKKEIIVE
jgi:hypothetical protein